MSNTEPTATVPQESKSGGTGWKIATVVLAVTTAGALGWGIYQTNELNELEESSAAVGDELTAEIEARNEALAAAKNVYDEGAAALEVSEAQRKEAEQAVAGLATALDEAVKAAEANAQDQAAQLAAAQAEAELAGACTVVLAGSLDEIYAAEYPSDVMEQVADVLVAVAPDCGVVIDGVVGTQN